jgi:murein DD-endopeptidase MepM/ murein hydrolase activator NlpD
VFCIWLTGAGAAQAGDEGVVIDLRSSSQSLIPHDDDGVRDIQATAATTATLPAPTYSRTGPRMIESVRLSPWPPVQGQTMSLWIDAVTPVTLSVSFLGKTGIVHGFGGGWALAPIDPLQKPGYAPLTIRAGAEKLVINVPVAAGKFETINIPASVAGPILSQTKKVNTEAAKMFTLFAGDSDGPFTPLAQFSEPVQGKFPASSAFGSRRTYGNDPTLSAHAGEDFPAAAGTSVYAPADATVVLAEKLFVRGNAIVLDHGNGVFTGYWHLSEIDVKPGEKVEAGQLLGKVGSTGLSTGAHLHWEMRVDGVAVDPLQWVVGAE